MISAVGLHHLYVNNNEKRCLDVLVGAFDFDHVISQVKLKYPKLSEWLSDDNFDVHIIRIADAKTMDRGIIFDFQNIDNDYVLVSESFTSNGWNRRTYMMDIKR